MATAKVYSMDGTEGGALELSNAVFDVEPNGPLMHQVVVALLNARRQGNAETKVRKDVRGGGAKPFAQKGTGRARQGSSREPHMRGGGVVFGPHKRSYRQKTPLKMRRKALCCALTDRVRSEDLCIVESLKIEGPKTQPVAEMFSKLSPEGRKTLVVTAGTSDGLVTSARNMPRLTIRRASDVNALDVLNAKRIIVVKDALGALEERLS